MTELIPECLCYDKEDFHVRRLLPMSNALLTTKLYFSPPRPSLVPRLPLIERLQASLQGHLTLISAPTGAGKTTVFSQLRLGPGSGTPATWLSLDPADNDPRYSLQYLSAALDILGPGLEEEVRLLLQSTELPNGEAILILLINPQSWQPGCFLMIARATNVR